MDNTDPQRDKRFDILLFFVGVTLLCSGFTSSFSSPEKHNNLHEYLVVTKDKIELKTDSKPRSSHHTITPPDFRPFFWEKIPINKADKPLLMTVRGIGPSLAEKIIQTREIRGFFNDINELKQIRGVGQRRAAYFKNVFDFGDSQ